MPAIPGLRPGARASSVTCGYGWSQIYRGEPERGLRHIQEGQELRLAARGTYLGKTQSVSV